MTRTITGTGTGNYTYNSITPDDASIVLQDIPTQLGHEDVMAISADATQLRSTPAADKTFALSIARVVENQARALSVTGVGGGPTDNVDITISPELSVVRVGNRGATRNLRLKAVSVPCRDGNRLEHAGHASRSRSVSIRGAWSHWSYLCCDDNGEPEPLHSGTYHTRGCASLATSPQVYAVSKSTRRIAPSSTCALADNAGSVRGRFRERVRMGGSSQGPLYALLIYYRFIRPLGSNERMNDS